MKASIIAIAAIAGLLSNSPAHAAVTRRSKGQHLDSSIKSFSLQSWGPLESSTSGQAVFVDTDFCAESKIQDLVGQGKAVVCYISAGTLEKFRSDKTDFINDGDVLAKKYKGFGGTETWFDVTKWEDIKVPMQDRIQKAAQKGCTAIELDNVDCFENGCVSGASYDELKSKQIEYVNWLVKEAHSHGLDAGQKNAIEIISRVNGEMDFAINEECQKYGECGHYTPFTKHNKVVFGVEYDNNGGKVCSEAKKNDIVTKYRDNGKWHDCF